MGSFRGLHSAGKDYSRRGLRNASPAPAWLCSPLSASVPHPSSIRAQIFPNRSVSPRDPLGAGLICVSKWGLANGAGTWHCPRELLRAGLGWPIWIRGLCHLSCSQLCLELLQEPRALKKTLLQPQPLFQISQLLPAKQQGCPPLLLCRQSKSWVSPRRARGSESG